MGTSREACEWVGCRGRRFEFGECIRFAHGGVGSFEGSGRAAGSWERKGGREQDEGGLEEAELSSSPPWMCV